MAKILVIDDEMGIRELLSEILDDEGHEIVLAENAAHARPLYDTHSLDLVLLDIWMPDTDGMSLLREWTCAAPLKCPVIMMSGHASIDTAVEAQALGAVGFLEKPITMHKLLAAVHKALYRTVAPPTPEALPAVIAPIAQIVSPAPPALASIEPTQAIEPLEVLAASAPTPAASPQTPPTPALPALSPWHEALSCTTLDTGLREFREQVERVYFSYILEREQWAMTRVAELAGLERTHLYRKLKQLNIKIDRK
jgi:DNA-binding NtrC family response regulator